MRLSRVFCGRRARGSEPAISEAARRDVEGDQFRLAPSHLPCATRSCASFSTSPITVRAAGVKVLAGNGRWRSCVGIQLPRRVARRASGTPDRLECSRPVGSPRQGQHRRNRESCRPRRPRAPGTAFSFSSSSCCRRRRAISSSAFPLFRGSWLALDAQRRACRRSLALAVHSRRFVERTLRP